jgi:hypothetical protein
MANDFNRYLFGSNRPGRIGIFILGLLSHDQLDELLLLVLKLMQQFLDVCLLAFKGLKFVSYIVTNFRLSLVMHR